jgi:glutaredoxin-related protein
MDLTPTQKGIGVLVALLLLVFSYCWYMAANIRALRDGGWVFYHSPTCGFCVTQIAAVGASKFSWMPMVNCAENPTLCKEKGINAFPTWMNENTGQIYVGSILLDNGDDSKLLSVLEQAPARKVVNVNIKIGDKQS